MMFDTFAQLLSSIPTFLFPVFASYKALKTSDPALLAPWLMYWVVLAVTLFVESWFGFILTWTPFYAWIRLFFLLYLILPQTQGARVLYQQHVEPFLHDNEVAIDDFISSAHDRAKEAGIEYVKQAIEIFKQHVLGQLPRAVAPTPRPSNLSYAQNLLARFNLPSARPSDAPIPGSSTAEHFYSLLASAVNAATSSSVSALRSNPTAQDLSNSGTLISPAIEGTDRLSFITAQRERLSILISALDKEASHLQSQRSGNAVSEESTEDSPKSVLSGLSTRKSEVDFEKIDAESGAEDNINGQNQFARKSQNSGGSWLPWSWGAKTESSVHSVNTVIPELNEPGEGKSFSVDI